jgi:hypothetical protein
MKYRSNRGRTPGEQTDRYHDPSNRRDERREQRPSRAFDLEQYEREADLQEIFAEMACRV